MIQQNLDQWLGNNMNLDLEDFLSELELDEKMRPYKYGGYLNEQR